jgi:hypothetical protein
MMSGSKGGATAKERVVDQLATPEMVQNRPPHQFDGLFWKPFTPGYCDIPRLFNYPRPSAVRFGTC